MWHRRKFLDEMSTTIGPYTCYLSYSKLVLVTIIIPIPVADQIPSKQTNVNLLTWNLN